MDSEQNVNILRWPNDIPRYIICRQLIFANNSNFYEGFTWPRHGREHQISPARLDSAALRTDGARNVHIFDVNSRAINRHLNANIAPFRGPVPQGREHLHLIGVVWHAP